MSLVQRPDSFFPSPDGGCARCEALGHTAETCRGTHPTDNLPHAQGGACPHPRAGAPCPRCNGQHFAQACPFGRRSGFIGQRSPGYAQTLLGSRLGGGRFGSQIGPDDSASQIGSPPPSQYGPSVFDRSNFSQVWRQPQRATVAPNPQLLARLNALEQSLLQRDADSAIEQRIAQLERTPSIVTNPFLPAGPGQLRRTTVNVQLGFITNLSRGLTTIAAAQINRALFQAALRQVDSNLRPQSIHRAELIIAAPASNATTTYTIYVGFYQGDVPATITTIDTATAPNLTMGANGRVQEEIPILAGADLSGPEYDYYYAIGMTVVNGVASGEARVGQVNLLTTLNCFHRS